MRSHQNSLLGLTIKLNGLYVEIIDHLLYRICYSTSFPLTNQKGQYLNSKECGGM